MKKCPTCERTFDDAMKFCQTDGTPLISAIEDAAPDDVYETTVGRQEDIAAAMQPDPFKTMIGGSFNKDESGDLLQIPDNSDPLKMMYTTDEEMKREMSAHKPINEGVVEIAPLADDSTAKSSEKVDDTLTSPPVPRFDEPKLTSPNFGEQKPSAQSNYSADSQSKVSDSFSEPSAPKIPSPFEDKTEIIESKSSFDNSPYNSQTSAIPSPFNESRPSSYDPPLTPLPTYKEPESPRNDPFNQPMYTQPLEQNQPLQPSEWTPPPAPDANWQNQAIGANTPFQPPAAGTGQNNTLSIISLVLGILSIPCCGFVVFGIAAAVTGFLAKKKADQNPDLYGGKGMALAGMIIGIITAVIGLILTVLQIFFGALNSLGSV